jgi:hypothetical protein
VEHIIVSAQMRSFDDGVAGMRLDDYRQSLTAADPPARLPLALAGLWWDAKGDGRQAHESARQDSGPEGSVGARLFASEGRRSGQRSLLVQSGGEAWLPRATGCAMA